MNANSPMTTQIGGNHYQDLKIQPAEFWIHNQLPATEGAIVKYLTRHSFKNGRQDCEKALHFVDMLIWLYFDAPIEHRAIPKHFRDDRSLVIQPRSYCHENKIPMLEASAIQLVCDFSCRTHLEVVAELIGKIMQRDYTNVPVPVTQLPRSDVLYLAKEHLENYATLLADGGAPADRVHSVINRIKAEWERS